MSIHSSYPKPIATKLVQKRPQQQSDSDAADVANTQV
jgi:hypothetical protein